MTGALLEAVWTLVKRYWFVFVILLLALFLAIQSNRLHHAKADLRTCAAGMKAANAAVAAIEDKGRADTAAAQKVATADRSAETVAGKTAAQILRPRPGAATDCASARQAILDALK